MELNLYRRRTHRQTHRQTCRQTHTQTDTQTDRHTHRHTEYLKHYFVTAIDARTDVMCTLCGFLLSRLCSKGNKKRRGGADRSLAEKHDKLKKGKIFFGACRCYLLNSVCILVQGLSVCLSVCWLWIIFSSQCLSIWPYCTAQSLQACLPVFLFMRLCCRLCSCTPGEMEPPRKRRRGDISTMEVRWNR